MAMPKVVEVRLENKLGPWIQAKDIILELLRRRDVKGGIGRIFEFTGPGVETLSVPERGTICNMIAELGATTGIFSSDHRTKEWLVEQKRPADFVALAADDGASYDEREIIDLAKLEPLIALGENFATTDPDVALRLALRRLDELDGELIDVGGAG